MESVLPVGDSGVRALRVAECVVLAGFGIVAAGEVVAAEVLIVAVAGEQVPDDYQNAVPDGQCGLGLGFLAEAAMTPSVSVSSRSIAPTGCQLGLSIADSVRSNSYRERRLCDAQFICIK
jgi:hypothetical protein